MPKFKISKTIKDRFKITKKGNVLHLSGGRKHWRYKERVGFSRKARRLGTLSGPDRKRLNKVLGV